VTLSPWLEVATPHKDIADGSFDESLFAADLGLVAEGRGPEDYLNPETFAAKTYLTGNLKAALVEVGNRLNGDNTAAGVYRLQTEFGGGKTHTLLVAFHCFGSPERVRPTKLGRDLADALKAKELPKAKVVVLDGAALRPDPVKVEDGVVLHSYLGHLAWRLGGRDFYEKVRTQDERLLGTSTSQLLELLDTASPCLILLDETLEYLNKVLEVKSHEGNLAATTLTTIKELCTSAANVPGVAVIATLTSSRAEDYASVSGQDMQDRLSRVVGRTENIVTPVEGDDVFPILQIRLFDSVGDVAERRKVADAYGAYYEQLGDVLPSSFREGSFRDRIESAYPFHPELIDILTNRWGSLSGFQRTRGALRMLAHTVKALCQQRNQATLILPGDVPLGDAGVRAEILRFAGESFKSALNSDIIRSDSKAVDEDRRRGGEVERNHIGVGLATTAFLDSFGPDKVVGASVAQMFAGVGRPDISRGVIEDIRDALAQTLWYMRYEGGRYRFTTEPNLNKVIIEREGSIDEGKLAEVIREAFSRIAPQVNPFRVEVGVSVPPDIVDEQRLVLGLLDLMYSVGPETSGDTFAKAKEILTTRGNTSRVNKNAALLVAAETQMLGKARQTARTLAAMREINADRHRLERFNKEQREQLAERLSEFSDRLPQQLVMAYHHLVMLSGDGHGGMQIQQVDLGPARITDTVPSRVRDYLIGNDRMLDDNLSPAALLSSRFHIMSDDDQAVEVDKLLSFFYRLPRLPRLASPDVLRRCLAAGVEGRMFGLASGRNWNAPDAVLKFGERFDPSEIQFQPGTWLVRAAATEALVQGRGEAAPAPGPPALVPAPGGTTGEGGGAPEPGGQRPKDPTRVRIRVGDVPADKVRDVLKVALFPLAANGAEVLATIDIVASKADGVSRRDLDLVVAEGLRQLGLDTVIRDESAPE